MKNNTLYVIGAIFFTCITSCKGPPPDTGNTSGVTSTTINESIHSLKENSEEFKNIHKNITDNSDTINSKANQIEETSNDPNIDGMAKEIETAAQKIKEDALILEEKAKQDSKSINTIENNLGNVKKLENTIQKLKEENIKAKQEAIGSLYRTMTFFFGLGVVAIIAGIALAWFVSKKLGFAIAGIGLLTIAIASAATFYMQSLATIGIIVLILSLCGLVAVGVWQIIKLYKANVENVQLVETIKKDLPTPAKEKIFGPENLGMVRKIQTTATANLVKQIRSKITK